MAELWSINDILAERNRFREFGKKHPRELAACFSNLDFVISLLNQFGSADAFQVGFFRSEGGGVYRIGQTGVKHAAETRLYVYVYAVGRTVYVLTIGDKKQQAGDIRRCKGTIKKFEARRSL